MPRVGVFVPVSAVFPELSADFETFSVLLHGLSRTDTLFWCARLNLILSNSENRNAVGKQEYAIHRFLNREEIDRLNDFVGKHGGSDRVGVFYRAQLLEVMRWTCLLSKDHEYDGKTFEDPAVRRRFTQAAMIASDLWAKRVYEGMFASTTDVPAARREAMAAMRSSISMNMAATELSDQLARGVSIYGDVFRQKYPAAESDFYAAMGMSLDQYLACVCGLAIHVTRVTPETAAEVPGGFTPANLGANVSPEMAVAIERYVTLESQTPDQLREALWGKRTDAAGLTGLEPFTTTPLRERPILRTPDGRAIILDPVFFSEKTSVGPLFALVKAAAEAGRSHNSVFGAFGFAFEGYMQAILRTMYPTASPLLDRLRCNPRPIGGSRNEEICDACMFDATEAVLFEAKGVFVREDAAWQEGIDAYLSVLREKYSVSEGRKGPHRDRRVKGAAQLARSIRYLAEGSLIFPGPDWARVRQVYAVLVVYDVTLGAPGHAEFFVEEFAKELAPDDTKPNGFMQKGPLTVAPLTVMTIEDLENLESSVEHFRLVDLLRDYACTTTKDGVRPSLHDFMAEVERVKKYRLVYSKEQASRARKVLDRMAQMMFPGVVLPKEPGEA